MRSVDGLASAALYWKHLHLFDSFVFIFPSSNWHNPVGFATSPSQLMAATMFGLTLLKLIHCSFISAGNG